MNKKSDYPLFCLMDVVRFNRTGHVCVIVDMHAEVDKDYPITYTLRNFNNQIYYVNESEMTFVCHDAVGDISDRGHMWDGV